MSESMTGRTNYSVLLTLMMAANLIAFVFSGTNLRYFVVSTVSFGLLLFVFDKVTGLIRRAASSGNVRKKYEQDKKEVLAQSDEEAAMRAEEFLADPHKFVVEKAQSNAVPRRNELASELQAFFTKYESVRETGGEFNISWKLIGESDFRPGFLRIGTDFDQTELVVKPGVKTVYEIDGSERDESEMTMYPSIFHLILLRD